MTASKLGRILAISVVLTALSLGGVAHAQESDTGLGGTATTAAPAASTRPGCCSRPACS